MVDYTSLVAFHGFIIIELSSSEMKRRCRDLRNIKDKKAKKFVFLSNQILEKLKPSEQFYLEKRAEVSMLAVKKNWHQKLITTVTARSRSGLPLQTSGDRKRPWVQPAIPQMVFQLLI